MSTLTVEVIRDPNEFQSLQNDWNELLSESAADSLFLRHEWLHTWWSHLGRDKQPFIVLLRSGSQLAAIAPLTLRRPWIGPLTVPLLEFAGAGTVGSDYLDVIVRRGYEDRVRDELASFIAGTGYSVRFTNTLKGDSMAAALGRDVAGRRWGHQEIPFAVCPFISLRGMSWDCYLAALGPNHRYNFRRRLRGLEKCFAVGFERVTEERERSAVLRTLVDMHLRRWEGRGGSDAFAHPGLVAFHESFSRLALERGWLRLMTLTLDGVPAASFYCFRYGGSFCFYQSGLNREFERHSPGLVTMGLTIRTAIEEGSAEFDFLHGEESYKWLWARECRPLIRIDLYPPGPRGRIHRKAVRLISATRKLTRRVLDGIAPSPELTPAG